MTIIAALITFLRRSINYSHICYCQSKKKEPWEIKVHHSTETKKIQRNIQCH